MFPVLPRCIQATADFPAGSAHSLKKGYESFNSSKHLRSWVRPSGQKIPRHRDRGLVFLAQKPQPPATILLIQHPAKLSDSSTTLLRRGLRA